MKASSSRTLTLLLSLLSQGGVLCGQDVAILGQTAGRGVTYSHDADCFIVTPAHVVASDSGSELTIVGQASDRAQARTEYFPPGIDIAVLRVTSNFGCRQWPHRINVDSMLNAHTTASLRYRREDGTLAQFPVYLQDSDLHFIWLAPMHDKIVEGMSGGVVVADGEVLGMLVAVKPDSAVALRFDRVSDAVQPYIEGGTVTTLHLEDRQNAMMDTLLGASPSKLRQFEGRRMSPRNTRYAKRPFPGFESSDSDDANCTVEPLRSYSIAERTDFVCFKLFHSLSDSTNANSFMRQLFSVLQNNVPSNGVLLNANLLVEVLPMLPPVYYQIPPAVPGHFVTAGARWCEQRLGKDVAHIALIEGRRVMDPQNAGFYFVVAAMFSAVEVQSPFGRPCGWMP